MGIVKENYLFHLPLVLFILASNTSLGFSANVNAGI
jgi:hypothetical protein